ARPRIRFAPTCTPLYPTPAPHAPPFPAPAAAARALGWRMPLWRPYESLLDSKTADINNVGGPQAGSITAALFLARFVPAAKAWAHFDIYALTPSAKAAPPDGGECPGARAPYALL